MAKPLPFQVGDRVKPKPEWRHTGAVPKGRVRQVEPWGQAGEAVIYLDGDHRGFASFVFDLVRKKGKRR